MNMKSIMTSITLAAVLLPATANTEPVANVALTTDYVWRGISQTQKAPAIQGGFDLAHDSGLYIGVWASNVNFVDDDTSDIETGYRDNDRPARKSVKVRTATVTDCTNERVLAACIRRFASLIQCSLSAVAVKLIKQNI
jgi:hypothetical protein